VLPRYRNTPYIKIKEGNHFGIIDIVGSCQINDVDLSDWYKKKSLLSRQFTIQSRNQCEVLILSLQHLYQMEQEFIDCFDDLFQSSLLRLKNAWLMKLKSMQKCQEIQQTYIQERREEELRKGSNESFSIISSSCDYAYDENAERENKTVEKEKKTDHTHSSK
jgi:hypothetical protein